MYKPLSIDDLKACMRGCASFRAARYLAHLNYYMPRYLINTPMRAAMFLAQVGHESDSLRKAEDPGTGIEYNGNERLGNTDHRALQAAAKNGMEPGPFFRGHGLLRLNGYRAHLGYSMSVYGDDRAAENPLLLTADEEAVRSACWLWSSTMNSLIADKNTEEAFTEITLRLTGGKPELEERLSRWRECKKVLEVRDNE